jgi:hypothetical protein
MRGDGGIRLTLALVPPITVFAGMLFSDPTALAQPASSTTHSATILRAVTANLRSGDPRLVAWGAHDAARYALPQTLEILSTAMVTFVISSRGIGSYSNA